MTAQESLEIFGALTETDDPAVITDQEREAFQADLKRFWGHFDRAKNAILNMGRELLVLRDKYETKFVPLITEQLPGLTPATRENYIALASWCEADPDAFDQWYKRVKALGIMYELSKAALMGNDLEQRYIEVAARRRGLLGDGNGSSALASELPADLESAAPGLYALVSSGVLHPTEAGKIIHTALDAHHNAVQVVRQHGILNAAALEALSKVAHSIDATPGRRTDDLTGLFLQLHNTGGYLTLPEGEQVMVNLLSNREIWSAYRESVKESSQAGVTNQTKCSAPR